MKNSIFKKLFSFLTLIALLSSFSSVSALTAVQSVGPVAPIGVQPFKAIKPVYNPKFILDKNLGSFSVNTKAIKNKQVLELAPITSSNAGKILNTWNINSSFNKNFVVRPVGTNYNFLVMKLDEKGLKESLEKTNFARQTFNQYRGVSGGLGKLIIDTPKLERLPDRLVLTSKTQIKFKTLAEFENIKKYYKLDSKEVISSLASQHLTQLPKTGLTSAGVFKKGLAGKQDLINNGRVVGTKLSSEIEKNFFKDLFDGCVRNSTCRGELAKQLGKKSSDLRVYIPLTHKYIYANYKSEYEDIIAEMLINGNEENIIESVEKIEMSLLPVDPLNSANFNNNLSLAPNLVRISGNKIKNIFINIEKVSKIGNKLQEVESGTNNDNDIKKICDNYTGSEKSACLKLADTYVNPETKKYEKILINGITLGNEYHYNFYRKWRKKFGWRWASKTVTIYEVNIDLKFGYGFGIRIPIKTEIEINKDAIKVGANQTDKKFKAKMSVKTIDATAQEYRDAGIVESQIFDGKEFVFKMYAILKGKLVLANSTVFDREYDLIEMLGKLIGINGLHSFDKSRDFIPPYNGTNKISLLEREFGIEVYKKNYALGGGTIYADLLFEAWIDGYVTAYCKTINAVGNSCNKKLYFGKTGSHVYGNELPGVAGISGDAIQTIELEARNTGNKKEDLLGEFTEYGIILKDFKYIPQLVATIKSRARLHYWYDVKVRDGSGDLSTPWYEVYRFTLDLAELGAHVGYGNGGVYNLTEDQKQIKATNQRFYSKLKEKFQIYLITFFPVYKIYFPDMGLIIPSDDSGDDETQNDNQNRFPGKGDIGKIPGKWDIPGKIPGTLSGSSNNQDDNNEIDSFIECARAGYSVSSGMEPNTCTDPDGNIFMEDLRGDEEEGENNEEVDNDFGNAGEDIINDWIQENDEPDDNAVDEEVAIELNKYLQAANNLALNGVINNHATDPINYGFSSTIMRNEAGKMAVNLDPTISVKSSCDNEFADVSKTTPNTWTCGYIEALRDAGKLSKNKNFSPLSQLSKAEATKMMLEAAGCENVYTHAEFWQAEVAAYAGSNSLIPLFTDYNTKATRAFVFAIADAARVFCAK